MWVLIVCVFGSQGKVEVSKDVLVFHAVPVARSLFVS